MHVIIIIVVVVVAIVVVVVVSYFNHGNTLRKILFVITIES